MGMSCDISFSSSDGKFEFRMIYSERDKEIEFIGTRIDKKKDGVSRIVFKQSDFDPEDAERISDAIQEAFAIVFAPEPEEKENIVD